MREHADIIEMLDKRKDAVRDRDHPVPACGSLFPANHVMTGQMDVFHTHTSQLRFPEAGVSLDQDDLVQVVVLVGPEPAEFFRSKRLMLF